MSEPADNPIRLGLLYLHGDGLIEPDAGVLARLMTVTLCERLREIPGVQAHVLELTAVRDGQRGRIILDLETPLPNVQKLVAASLAMHPGIVLDHVLYGELHWGSTPDLALRLFRLTDGKVWLEGRWAGPPGGFFALIGRAVAAIGRALDRDISEALEVWLGQPETPSLEACLECARGLDSLTPAAAQAGRDPDQAIDYLVAAVALDPAYERPYRMALLYALDCLERGELERGAAVLQKLLAHRPDDPEAWSILGHAQGQQGRWAEASLSFEQSLSLRPNASAWAGLGMLYEAQGERALAIDCYQRARQSGPLPSETRQRLGTLLLQENRAEEAIELWDELTRDHPTDARRWTNLGLAYQQRGAIRQAERCYERALAQEPPFWGAYYSYGWLCWQTNRLEQAQKLYQQAVVLKPDHGLIHHELATVLLHQAQFEAARTHFQRALELGLPAEQQAQVSESLAQLNDDQFRREIQAYADHRRCVQWIHEGEPEKAVRGLQAVLQVLPDHWSSWFYLGLAHQRTDRPLAAARAFQKVLALEPGQTDAHKELTLALLKLGRYEEAYRHAEKAYQERPGEPEIVRNFGLACAFVGRWEAAEWLFRLAKRLNPTDLLVEACLEMVQQKTDGGWE